MADAIPRYENIRCQMFFSFACHCALDRFGDDLPIKATSPKSTKHFFSGNPYSQVAGGSIAFGILLL